jgi:6-phosphogluconolactonase/glucosamine-6-phosphate isomerase/deaminase
MAAKTANLKIIRCPSETDAARQAGQALSNLLAKLKLQPVLLLLSGGSALKILDHVEADALGANLTISMVDDRFSQEKSINNFLMFQNTGFYRQGLDKDVNFIGTLPRNRETKEQLAGRLEKSWRSWSKANPRGKLAAVLGMGPDGHTAGIMPFNAQPEIFHNLFGGENWVTAYSAQGKSPYPERVTATLELLKLIDNAVIYVAGKTKQPALKQVLEKQGPMEALPALSWWTVKKAEIFTDLD